MYIFKDKLNAIIEILKAEGVHYLVPEIKDLFTVGLDNVENQEQFDEFLSDWEVIFYNYSDSFYNEITQKYLEKVNPIAKGDIIKDKFGRCLIVEDMYLSYDSFCSGFYADYSGQRLTKTGEIDKRGRVIETLKYSSIVEVNGKRFTPKTNV